MSSTDHDQENSGTIVGDKYRSYLHEEADTTLWRYGGPPTFDLVNQVFEQGRTKVVYQIPIFICCC